VLPILVTELEKLKVAKRIVVVVNRSIEDLGIWSARTARGEAGIEAGSVISLIKDMRAREAARGEEEETAFVIANSGQLLYSHKQKRAMSMAGWQAMQRPSALHAAPIVDEMANRVEGSRTVEEHLRSVMRMVVGSEKFVDKQARMFLIGVGDGSNEVCKILEEMCMSCSDGFAIYRDPANDVARFRQWQETEHRCDCTGGHSAFPDQLKPLRSGK